MVYILNGLIKNFGPYYWDIPSHTFDTSDNLSAFEPYIKEISDMIQMSVVPTNKGDDIQPCMTYNPPGPFKTGYDISKSVSVFSLFFIYKL